MSMSVTDKATVLVVDDTPANLQLLLDYLPRQGFKVLVATNGERALQQVERSVPDLILLDVVMPGLDGFDTCARLKGNASTCDIPVIFMSARSETVDKLRGFKAGAVDYITKPFQYEEVLARVTTHIALCRLQAALQEANDHLEQRVTERTAQLESALSEVQELKNRLKAENDYLRGELSTDDGIIGESPKLKKILQQVAQVASLDTTVLILGETGTGKELIARALHQTSPRCDRPLIKVNCAALPATLIESELFGHEKGSFTGATKKHIGRFELAAGGTIFLDEIGDLPLELQTKLLRVLQEGEFERIGSGTTLTTNARVVAATNRHLEQAIREGKFREDLFYRLNVFPIEIPPLRDRADDIPLLVKEFVARCSAKIGRDILEVPSETLAAYRAYSWPGNVRELQNVVERAIILASDGVLRVESNLSDSISQTAPIVDDPTTFSDMSRRHILQVLQDTGWVIDGSSGAAHKLGLKASTLRYKMRKLGIVRPHKAGPGASA
jgi:formate hydrogenlyase transcriptional activator